MRAFKAEVPYLDDFGREVRNLGDVNTETLIADACSLP